MTPLGLHLGSQQNPTYDPTPPYRYTHYYTPDPAPPRDLYPSRDPWVSQYGMASNLIEHHLHQVYSLNIT